MLEEQRGQELAISRLQQERDKLGIEQDIEAQKRGFDRDQDILDAKAKAEKAESGIETLGKLKAKKREDEIARKNAEVDADIRLAQGMKDLTPEQMLALKARDSKDAGAALAAKYQAEAAQYAFTHPVSP